MEMPTSNACNGRFPSIESAHRDTCGYLKLRVVIRELVIEIPYRILDTYEFCQAAPQS